METSIIIRTKNEDKWLGKLLEILSNQTYKNFEIIIVDSGSTDNTLNIIKNFNVKLIQIKQEEFSYPHALNIGCLNSNAEKYFVFINGHCLPISNTWLEDGIKNFTDNKIFGIYGGMQALPDGSFIEKLVTNKLFIKLMCKLNVKIKKTKDEMGLMGFTNAIIRKDLWKIHNIDETYGSGGEDGAWARYWLEKGYYAIKDFKFSVSHSHSLGLRALLKQFKHWKSTRNPAPYKALEYRKNFTNKK